MSNIAVDFELNIDGLNALMKSDGMKAHLEKAGAKVQQQAGYGYDHRVVEATYEAIGQVYPHSGRAARDNSENNTLVKALQSAGLSMSKE